MKSLWKRVFIWSSLGSLAVGGAVALVRKPKKGIPIAWKKIPPECAKATIYTVEYVITHDSEKQLTRDKYVLLSTPFRVWSLLDPVSRTGGNTPEGAGIYHITQWRSHKRGDFEEEEVLARLYGRVGSVSETGELGPKNQIARGAILAIHECRVGGASNGVETGDVYYSDAPILNYRFDFAAGEDHAKQSHFRS